MHWNFRRPDAKPVVIPFYYDAQVAQAVAVYGGHVT